MSDIPAADARSRPAADVTNWRQARDLARAHLIAEGSTLVAGSTRQLPGPWQGHWTVDVFDPESRGELVIGGYFLLVTSAGHVVEVNRPGEETGILLELGFEPQARTSDLTRLPADWEVAIGARCDLKAVYEAVARLYSDSCPGAAVLPPHRDLFRAFHLTPIEKVRVVILGQDPYPRPGEAHGLAFSVPAGVDVPLSLKRIFKSLDSDPNIVFASPGHGDLTEWAQSGVLLLNSALTVVENDSGSHEALWSGFTAAVIESIDQLDRPVVCLAWGVPALRWGRRIQNPKHKVVFAPHPAARGAHARQFIESRHFSEALSFLAIHESLPDPRIWPPMAPQRIT